MAAICSRVIFPSGLKRPSPTPLTMALAAAHSMGREYHLPSGTSVKVPLNSVSGLPVRRYRMVTSWARVTMPSGLNLSPPTPFMYSFFTMKSMPSWAQCPSGGTSEKPLLGQSSSAKAVTVTQPSSMARASTRESAFLK